MNTLTIDDFLKANKVTKEQMDKDLGSVTLDLTRFIQARFFPVNAYRLSIILGALDGVKNGLVALGEKQFGDPNDEPPSAS